MSIYHPVDSGVSTPSTTVVSLARARAERSANRSVGGIERVRLAGSSGRYYVTPRDPRAFYAAHPECRLTEERLSDLEPLIRYWVRRFMTTIPSSYSAEDYRQALIEGLVRNGCSYRIGDGGRPVFDFFAQNKTYIVQRAADSARNLMRDEGRRSKMVVALDPDAMDAMVAQHDVSLMDVEAHDLADQIRRGLSPAQQRIFDALVLHGNTQGIARELGITRQRLSAQMRVIRERTRSVIESRTISDRPATRRRACV